MKINKLIKLSPVLLGLLTFSVTSVIFTQLAQADAVQTTQNSVVTVTLPAGEKTGSYKKADGTTVQIAAGATAIIPAGATDISLPSGSTLSVKIAAVAIPAIYDVVNDVTLPSLSQASFQQRTASFSNREVNGGRIESLQLSNPATLGTGTDKS